jgi:hypothetical protein
MNEAGQKDALRRGGPAARKQTHWANLPAVAEVLSEIEVDTAGKASFDFSSNVIATYEATGTGISSHMTTPMFDRCELSYYPTHDQLVEATLARIGQRRDFREKLNLERQQRDEAIRSAVRAVLAGERVPPVSNLTLYGKTIQLWHPTSPLPPGAVVPLSILADATDCCLDLAAVDWIRTQDEKNAEAAAFAEAEKRERAAKEQMKKDEEKKARLAAQKEGEAAMLRWIREHGSERLKLLVSEGFQWKSVAHEEWVAANTPDGFVAEWGPDYVGKERLKPTLEELVDYKIYNNPDTPRPHIVEVDLCWNVAEDDHAIASLDLTLRSPLGETSVVAKFYEATRKPL